MLLLNDEFEVKFLLGTRPTANEYLIEEASTIKSLYMIIVGEFRYLLW